MGMKKICFSKEFFNEFCKAPEVTFRKYGIEFDDKDAAFFRQRFDQMTFDDFKHRVEKSRFISIFDFRG